MRFLFMKEVCLGLRLEKYVNLGLVLNIQYFIHNSTLQVVFMKGPFRKVQSVMYISMFLL